MIKPVSHHTVRFGIVICCLGVVLGVGAYIPVSAQAQVTATPPALSDQAYITNTFEGEPAINVRTGPSTFSYPVPCGSLAFGETAQALGISVPAVKSRLLRARLELRDKLTRHFKRKADDVFSYM